MDLIKFCSYKFLQMRFPPFIIMITFSNSRCDWKRI